LLSDEFLDVGLNHSHFAKISPAAAVQVNGFALAFQCVM